MATLGLSRLLPKPTQNYQVHKDDPSPAALARLEVRTRECLSYQKMGAMLHCLVDQGQGSLLPSLSKRALISETRNPSSLPTLLCLACKRM